jgi:hypothetical protein
MNQPAPQAKKVNQMQKGQRINYKNETGNIYSTGIWMLILRTKFDSGLSHSQLSN